MGRADVAVVAAIKTNNAPVRTLDADLIAQVGEYERAWGRARTGKVYTIVDLGCPLYKASYGFGLPGPSSRPEDAAIYGEQVAVRLFARFVDPALTGHQDQVLVVSEMGVGSPEP